MNAIINFTGIPAKKIVFTFTLLPVIFFFLHNIATFMERVLNKEVLLLFVCYTFFALFIYFIFKLLFRTGVLHAAILSGLTMTGFLFFGILQDYLLRYRQYSFLSNTYFLFLVILTVIVTVSMVIRNNPNRLNIAGRYFFILFILLIAFESGTIIYKKATGKSIEAITDRMIPTLNIRSEPAFSERPDIYYIIFDGYTNHYALKEYWGYEDEIYHYLYSKGFYTIDSAFSNYKSTPFSIGSVLNLQYLKGAEPYLLSNSSNFLIGQKVYRKNILFKFLKQQQYDFSIFSQLEDEKMLTAFGFLGVDKPVNWLRKLTLERIYLDPWKLHKLKSIFNKKSNQQAVRLESMLKFDDYNKKALAHILSDCEKSVTNKLTNPVFSYTHFMLPHNPYLRDENGNLHSLPEPEGGNMQGYLMQVKYSNKLIRQLTDCLLSDTARKKIIIFQGDHGFRHYTNAPEHKEFLALNAIYFYNQDYSGLRKNMSHVNTFRVVINTIFNGQMPLLEDRIFFLKTE